jgi:hypothetical protein
MPERLDEEKLADWRAVRDAVYQLAALTIGARLAVAGAGADDRNRPFSGGGECGASLADGLTPRLQQSGGGTIAEAEDIGDDIRGLFRREDQIRHLRMRRRQKHPEGGRRDAASVGDIPKTRPDDNESRCALFGLNHMAGITGFASEGMPGGNIAILRMRTEGGCG